MTAILVFVATAYALSIALSLVIGITGGHESRFIGLAYLSMFLPIAAVLIVNAAMNEGPRLRWDRFPPRYIPLALFLIPGVLHAVMVPLMAALESGVHWKAWLRLQPDGLYHTPALVAGIKSDIWSVDKNHPIVRVMTMGLYGAYAASRGSAALLFGTSSLDPVFWSAWSRYSLRSCPSLLGFLHRGSANVDPSTTLRAE